MHYDLFLPLKSGQRRVQNNRLRWIDSVPNEEELNKALNNRRDDQRDNYVVIARDKTVYRDPRDEVVDADYEALVDDF